jgi:hypothetical protein
MDPSVHLMLEEL